MRKSRAEIGPAPTKEKASDKPGLTAMNIPPAPRFRLTAERHQQFKNELEPYAERSLSDDEVSEMASNLVHFCQILAGWGRKEREAASVGASAEQVMEAE